jgi:predicted DNA binding CopG/RHH family protein
MKKQLPTLKSDKEAEVFVSTSDLTQYDLSKMKLMKFEFQAKDERLNMRLPGPLLVAIKVRAKKAGVPYQKFIRQVLEAALERAGGVS